MHFFFFFFLTWLHTLHFYKEQLLETAGFFFGYGFCVRTAQNKEHGLDTTKGKVPWGSL